MHVAGGGDGRDCPDASEPGPSPEVPAEVYSDAAAVIDSAIRGDRAAVVNVFDAAVGRAGLRAAYDVACCLAATLVGPAQPRGFASLDYPGIEQAQYESRWVARFVSAYANADSPTGQALFGAAMADGQLSKCLVTLAGSTAATLRHRGGGPADGGGPSRDYRKPGGAGSLAPESGEPHRGEDVGPD